MILTIPKYIKIKIFDYLELGTLLNLRLSCKSIAKFIADNKWKNIFISPYTIYVGNIMSTFNFQNIDLSWCINITENIMGYIRNCISVDLSFTNISSLESLQKCERLDLSYTSIKDTDLKYLANCHTLNISQCINITDKGILYLQNCKIISISGCHKITSIGIKHLKSLGTQIMYNNITLKEHINITSNENTYSFSKHDNSTNNHDLLDDVVCLMCGSINETMN